MVEGKCFDLWGNQSTSMKQISQFPVFLFTSVQTNLVSGSMRIHI